MRQPPSHVHVRIPCRRASSARAEILTRVSDEDAFAQFDITRPEHVGQAHVDSIGLELQRLARALDADDDAQAIGYLKCAVEAVAKVVLDINGTPADGAAAYPTTIKQAHQLLIGLAGPELAGGGPFAVLATQAQKMAGTLGEVRNSYGGGHGRARQPELTPEMLSLARDGGLLWLRWAMRRLGTFALGRPETLIRDLIGDPTGSIVWYSGDLTSRLTAADLAGIDPRHARAIGVAVGQRAAQETFNVMIEGIRAAVEDPENLSAWPAVYRIGAAFGLLFAPDERPTITAHSLHRALQLCLPLTAEATETSTLIGRVMASRPPGPMPGTSEQNTTLLWFVQQNAASRPPADQASWYALRAHLSAAGPAPAWTT